MTMTQAYLYGRFSKPDQQQRAMVAAEQYCQKHGLTLTDVPDDFGLLGVVEQGEGSTALDAFLEAIKQGDIPAGGVLLIDRLDRLSRERAFAAMRALAGILEAGVDVVTLRDQRRLTKDEKGLDALFTALLHGVGDDE
jgi:DNA invertase Pin-like site-specific DNA recombinase